MTHGTQAPTTQTPKPASKPSITPTEHDGDISSITMHVPWGENDGQVMRIARAGSIVTVNGSGWIKSGGSWVKALEHMPDGFRPISNATIRLSGDGTGILIVKPDGSIYWDGDSKKCYTHINGACITKDNQSK